MHSAGLSVTWLASAGLLLVSTSAFAQEAPAPHAAAAPTAQATPAGSKQAATAVTTVTVERRKVALAQPSGAAPAPWPPAGPPVPAAAPTADPTFILHVKSPRPVNLEQRPGPQAPWEYVCGSPCGLRVSKSAEFRVTGPGIMASKPMWLGAEPGDEVTVHVTPGDERKYKTGLVVAVAGGVVTVAGAIVLIATSGVTIENQNGNGNSKDIPIAIGTPIVLGGLAIAITGGAWAYDNAHSTMSTTPPPAPEKEGLLLPPTHTALDLPKPTAMMFPVVSGSF
jgi:hypothetical protein